MSRRPTWGQFITGIVIVALVALAVWQYSQQRSAYYRGFMAGCVSYETEMAKRGDPARKYFGNLDEEIQDAAEAACAMRGVWLRVQ